MLGFKLTRRLDPGLIRCTQIFTAQRNIANGSRNKQTTLDYCIELVRTNDFENYLCTLRLPDKARLAAFAIRAFNVELAKVKDSVSDRHIGSMRLLFWKDVINELYEGKPRAHPVVLLLAQVIQTNKLSKSWFSRLIAAREKTLDDKPFMTIEEIEMYGENSVSPVLYLILESLGIKDINTDHVASHIGRAISLTTVLRAVPFNAQRRKVFLPVDLLIKYKLPQEDIIRHKNPQILSDLVYEVASQAFFHLEKARNLKNGLSKEARKVCLSAVPCAFYLDKIQKLNFDVFHPKLQQRDWKLAVSILSQSILSTF
ncbi:NADH dehydrogenase (ubiquinone) complex I, assembly factor 6-like [Rhopilema esculentum]|uniref:NADH dehydrogenase (ubiquinone) complex I, assembly factor 6-like n=1 Tax=Rhopilema esculentum TaxID=499914 RepID=UPI0031DA6657